MQVNKIFVDAYVIALGKVRKIKTIVKKDTGVEVSFEGKNPVIVSLDEIEPIPLTSEILEKNGFRYYHRNFAQLSEESEFALRHDEYADENGISLWMYGCMKIRFVHELQHALRLCEIEKEITL